MVNSRPNPYVGPRAFEVGERLYGRAVETERLFNLLLAERIVLFYSPSGAGKTSLLQAALIPRLRAEGYRVSPPLRVNEPLPAGVSGNRYIYSVLRVLEEMHLGEVHPAAERLEPAALASLTLSDYLAQREAATPSEDEPVGEVLLFDQFEEALTINPTDQEAKTAFFAQVGAALRERHRWALFSLREDYLAVLEPYLRVIPTRGKVTFRLDLLGVDAARAALREPARETGVTFDDAAATQLVDDLRRVQVQQLDGSTAPALGPAIEPVQLQVVAYRLWDSLPPEAEHIGLDALTGLGHVNRALSDYYAQSVARIAAETGVSERTIRGWVERQLITEQGRRDLVARGPESSGGLANAAIARLENAHLVRAEQRAGTTWYELAHDRLVEPLQSDNAAWFAEHLSLLQRQAALWDEQKRADGLLLSGDALVEAEGWVKDHAGELTEMERDFMAACRDAQAQAKREQTQNRRIRWLAVGATFLMLLALVAAFFAWRQMQRAEEQTRVALARQLGVQAQYILDKPPAQLSRAALLAVESLRRFPESATNQTLAEGLAMMPSIAWLTHEEGAYAVAFSPDGQWAASAGCEEKTAGNSECISGSARVWEAATGREIARMTYEGNVWAVAFSPDGQQVVSAGCNESVIGFCSDGSARVWEAATGREIARMTHEGMVYAVAFSPDGRWVVSGSYDGTARVWEAATGREIARMTHEGMVYAVAFSPDGRWVVSGSMDGAVRVWEAATGRQIAQMTYEGRVTAVAFSPGGQWVVSAGCNEDEGDDSCTGGSARVWEAATGREVARMTHDSFMWAVAFSPDGQWVVSTGCDERDQYHTCVTGSARVWEAATGREIARMTHWDEVTAATFSLDGRWVVSGSRDGAARVWWAATGREIAQVIHGGIVEAVAFSPDGRWVISGSKDGAVQVWAVMTGREVAQMMHEGAVYTVAFSPDRRWVVSGSGDNTVRVWEVATGREIARMTHEGAVYDVAFSPDGQWVISGEGATARVWEAATGREIARMTYVEEASAVAFSPDGQWVVSSGCGEGVSDNFCTGRLTQVWEAVTGREIARIAHDGSVHDVAFSPDGRWVVFDDNVTARVWEEATGREIARMTHDSTVEAVAFSPDGRWVVSGSDDMTARVWEAATGREIARMTHEGMVLAVAFSPDGRWVVSSGSIDKTVRVWKATTGREIARMTHEGMAGATLAFSPDGRWVVSESGNVAQVWEAATGREVARTTHEGGVNAVAFSPDGQWVVSGGADGMVRVWRWQPEDLIEMVCERLPRNLTREEWAQYVGEEPYRATCPNLPEDPATND